MHPCDAILDFAPCRIGARFTGEALTQLNYLPPDTPLTRQHRPDMLAKRGVSPQEQDLLDAAD